MLSWGLARYPRIIHRYTLTLAKASPVGAQRPLTFSVYLAMAIWKCEENNPQDVLIHTQPKTLLQKGWLEWREIEGQTVSLQG